jgi:glycosyltransferase involved in cell wall biosynthesis
VSRIHSVHQMVSNAGPGNSISAGALMLRSALRGWGYDSEVYAGSVAPALSWGDILPFARYRPKGSDLLVFHYGQASPLSDYVKALDVPLVLVYHNVTPPEFFVGVNWQILQYTQRGQAELAAFRDRTVLALAVSEFNRRDLVEAGFTRTGVVPVIVPDDLQQVSPDTRALDHLENSVNLLCVGRVAPNKRLEHVIKVLFYYRQIEPRAQLLLVGSIAHTRPYVSWLRGLVTWLDLDDAVTFAGHVSMSELAAYYRRADVFIYMSEHEGFGIPLIECMRFGVPIVAYASTAIPETLGGAGILVREKRFPMVAELVHLLQTDADLRAQVIACQRERARYFEADAVLQQFRDHLDTVIGALR